MEGLARQARSDAKSHKFPKELVQLIEGLALRKPRLSCAAIHRRVAAIADAQMWRAPSYSTVHAIIRDLDPGMVTLAHEGAAAYRDRFELIHRHRALAPNALWQADHTMLDILVLDANGTTARPWLTVIMDDYSRAIAGYLVFLGAPSALHTSLALRQAIWRKQNSEWPVCGIPDVLYVDHGSDFTSEHLEQAAAALRMQIAFSTVARPQGRGKIERFFGTINTEVLPELRGHLANGKPSTSPKLSLGDLDTAIGDWFIATYNTRVHSETGQAPVASWRGDGWLPQMPDSLDDLDLLLVMVAKPRVVRRDGVHFQGLRFMSPILAPYVSETVTIRYDPRDLTEIRVFHQNRFLCRAISPDHETESVSLKDIQTARSAHRAPCATKSRTGLGPFLSICPNGPGAGRLPQRELSNNPIGCAFMKRVTDYDRASHGQLHCHQRAPALRRVCDGRAKTLIYRYLFWSGRRGKNSLDPTTCKVGQGWPLLDIWGPRDPSDMIAYKALAQSRAAFYTPMVSEPARQTRDNLSRLMTRIEGCIELAQHPERGLPDGKGPDLIQLLVIDEAERLSAQALEHVRDLFDRTGIGVILIGMPGLEKRLECYPQFYSRIGFAHHYRPLQGDELTFVLTRHWRKLGMTLDDADFTDHQAVASIARITGGNFRLLHRLFVQIERILKINELSLVTDEVVEAARSTLVIGAT
ncbi:Mu transposase C-terminal domain-containing protein [Leisingera sp. MMG026]|uniref:Mu transposase C-terminal domain-containing protein n=1 Tax=Leisingera sp. MMG026 TaxID=2909982 RepID=UPI001F1CC46E|nr:Mu transposase C-terminal domain-containing protein [Leisingera sp. MMG026]